MAIGQFESNKIEYFAIEMVPFFPPLPITGGGEGRESGVRKFCVETGLQIVDSCVNPIAQQREFGNTVTLAHTHTHMSAEV